MAPSLGFEPSSFPINSRARSPRVLRRNDNPIWVSGGVYGGVTILAEKVTFVKFHLNFCPCLSCPTAYAEFFLAWIHVVRDKTSGVLIPSTANTLAAQVIHRLQF